jgi:hypothetical protein
MTDQQSPTDDQKLDLAELFRKYGSDKDINGYSQVYFTLFDKMKDMKLNFLEIGIGTMIPGAHSSMVGYAPAHYKPGASLRAWRDFMPNSRIIGLDIQLDTQFSDEERIETYLCYSVGTDEVNRWHEKMDGLMFDVIIDDGSHVASDQLITLSNFYPMLKPGGIYIIEDVVENSALSTNPESIEEKCNGDVFFFVGVKNNICVIYKKPLNSNRAGY